ncbi:MAG TPA: hypothetical protein VHS78_19420 [Candidatus Elarobacter sp.]|jgi:hypothetical protein|nr:hypothetical protein [Candidatus Elarobacter sp.]
MLNRFSKFFMASGVAAAVTTGAMIPRPASADTTSTLLTAAAAIGAIVLLNNYQHKQAQANQIVGYTANGGTVYGDGRIVMPDGQTYYPNSNGQYAINNYGYNNGYNPSTYGYAPSGYYNNGSYNNGYYNNGYYNNAPVNTSNLPRYNTPGYPVYNNNGYYNSAQRRGRDDTQRGAYQQRVQNQNTVRWNANANRTNDQRGQNGDRHH